jgi:glycosidase
MLNSQFDFNVYFAVRDALVKGDSFKNLNRTILESMAAYGAHHTMGNISGNHDQIRFASMSGGAIGTDTNGKEEGWTSEVGIGDAETAYKRAILQEVINLTIPGVPCIYQGDEYAEVGGNDPDNRHLMRFDEQLNDAEKAYKDEVKHLIVLRRNSMALLYGDYVPVEVTDDVLVFDRIYMNEVVRVSVDKKNLTYSIIQQN